MKLTILSLAFLLVTVNAKPSNEVLRVKDCGETGPNFVAPRIVGGRVARKDELPFQASISLEGSKFIFCGGSVINDRWILTAANCFNGELPSWLKVSVGILDDSEVHSQAIPLERYWVHPKFKRFENEYDIALIKTAKSIKASSSHFVSPICLPFEDVDSADAEVATVSGFGKVEDKGEYSSKLRTANLKIVSQEECEDQFFLEKPELLLCAGASSDSTCLGDNGGPLAIKNLNGSYVLKGITSWGGCSQENNFGLFTKVSPYMDWIREMVTKNGLE